MVLKCCVCQIQTDDPNGTSVSYHQLPARENVRKEWMEALRKHCTSLTKKYLHVCSQHFEKDCSQYSGMCQRKMLKSGFVPTIFPHFEAVKCKKQVSDQSSGPATHLETTNEEVPQVENDFQLTERNVETDSTFSRQSPQETINQVALDKSVTENQMMQLIRGQNTELIKLRRTNKNLNIRLGRCRKKLYRYKHLFEALRRTKYISASENETLQEAIASDDRRKLEKFMNSRQTNGPLPSFLRKFACTLHFYSPKAYNYARETLIKSLPHPKTISKWYRKVRIGSGVSEAVIGTLKRKVSESTQPVLCNLVFDEMSIKKKVETVNGVEYGYVDLGRGDVADNVMVCMLICLTSYWKVPISYYFINYLNAEEKKNMVHENLKKIHETGVRIVSLTFDGPKTNLSKCELLGANLNVDEDMRNYFPHPITKDPIFIMIDACHCLKCARNSVAKDDKAMFDSDGNLISWSYINQIVILQNEHAELYLAHKVTTEHMQWQDNKMNVRIAAQTFSKSVSDALNYLEHKDNNPTFKGARGTSRFCDIVNEAFDILNSRTMFSKNPSKIGISASNIEAIEKRIEIIVKYIKGLKYIDGQKVVDSARKTGFIGMIIGLHSVVSIFRYYIQKEIPDGFLLTYKLSQDHLEIFFSATRSKGGYNNNPTCRLFMSIFKQLLIHTDVKGSDSGNCLALDETVTLEVSDIPLTVTEENNNDIESCNRERGIIMSPENNLYVHDAVSYTAGFVCRKILKISKCFECPIVLTHQTQETSMLESNSDYQCRLIDIKNRGGLIYPSSDVINICKITENTFKKYYFSRKGIFRELTRLAQKSVPRSCLELQHTASQNLTASKHRFQLIQKIISIYSQLRINKLEKEKQKPKKKLRRRYTKYILFNHE